MPSSRTLFDHVPGRHPAAVLLVIAAGAAATAVTAVPSRAAATSATSATAATAATAATKAGKPGHSRPAATIDSVTDLEPWQVNTERPKTGTKKKTSLFETFYPGGRIELRRGGADHPPPLAPGLHLRDAKPTAVAMHADGPAANRINLVFVGDGYTQDEQATFNASAERAWNALTSYEPYKTYQNFFDGWRVNLASPVSGISNDPANNTPRATPLGMHFWCHGIDRLLCVDTNAASAYGSLLPGAVSHVVTLAHTKTYGGAGGSITTLSGENPTSDAVIVHEMAHTLGGLGDEYFGTGTASPGGTAANTSASQESLMRTHKTKWYQWLGKPSPDGGDVGAYEGADYNAKGYFRPSQNSEMRSLGRPFNPPSVEALVKAFYLGRSGRGSVDPVDSVTPAPTAQGVRDRAHPLQVSLVPLVGRAYSVRWTIDAAPVAGADGKTSLDLTKAPLKKGAWNRVAVTVVDQNPVVLDEDFRLRHMTQTRSWSVWGG